ncbi:MAG: hypothetical protein K8R87_06225 [Verrucomicrobia bacterium]|nr:hypothetical protein [Verrucomicrobiota bacterium]
MKRFIASVGALTVSLLLSACFEVSSVVTVNKDGTGTIEETALVGAQMKAMMASMPADAGNEGGPNFKDMVPDKAKAEERAKKLGEGVTVKSHEPVKMPDGREGVKVTYAVADINKLKYQPFEAKDGGENEDKKPMTFALSGGTVTVNLPPDKPKEKSGDEKPKMPAEQMQAQMAMMKPMFAGMRMAVQIKGGSGIASSDASNLSGDTVTIMDINFDKLMEKPEVFGKFMESAEDKSMTPAQAAEKFKGVDGIKIEGKEKITIKLK